MMFNFHESLKDLYDFVFEFTVNNSRKMRSDALIGSFKLDLGNVYDQPGLLLKLKLLQPLLTLLGIPLSFNPTRKVLGASFDGALSFGAYVQLFTPFVRNSIRHTTSCARLLLPRGYL